MRGPTWNEKTVQRFIAEGRGKGLGVDYKPWLTVSDLSSIGESRRVPGLKIGREHQLLSEVEFKLFLLLEWSADVIDIREQFPLDRDLTQEIAAELGIRHPCYSGTHCPFVMTVDMLVTRRIDGKEVIEAFDAKRAEDVEDQRTLETLEITRYYFAAGDIAYRLVPHTALPDPEVTNIEWIRGAALSPEETEPYAGYFKHHKAMMASTLAQRSAGGSLAEFCDYYDRTQGIPPGDGLRIAKMLMWDRVVVADLTNADLATAPLASFRLTARKGAPRLVGSR